MKIDNHIKRPCLAPDCHSFVQGSKSSVCEFHRNWINCVYPNCDKLRRGRNILCSFHILRKYVNKDIHEPRKPRRVARDSKIRGREYYAENKEHIRELAHISYDKRKDEINAKIRQSRKENTELAEKNRIRCSEYRSRNIEEFRRKDRERNKTRPPSYKLGKILWREKNKERLKIWFYDYWLNNKQKYNCIQHRHRARKANAKGNHTYIQWLDKLSYYGWKCYYCKTILTDKTASEDHAIPLSRGGTNWIPNILPACCGCNRRKNNKTVAEFNSYKQQLMMVDK